LLKGEANAATLQLAGREIDNGIPSSFKAHIVLYLLRLSQEIEN